MNLKNKSIKLNAVLNILKQCCNIVFPLITYPYVSRALGASNLGKYSFADSIIQYFIIIATLGVPGYAIREGARIRDDKKKITEFSAEVFGINIMSLILSLALLSVTIIFVPRIHQEASLVCILSINVITNVLGRDWINSVYEDFSYTTVRYILFQIISLVLMLLFVKQPSDYFKYTCFVVVGTSGAQIANIIHTNKYISYKLSFSKNGIRHIKPILFMFCISVASVIYINSDVTMIGFYLPDSETGVYYLAGKVYTIIKTLLNSVITVTVPRISYFLGKDEDSSYQQLLEKLRDALITITLPCIVGIFSISNDIMLIVGGNEYASGSSALKILCIAMFFAVFGCFYSQAILITNREENIFFVATLISALANILLNFIFIPYFGIDGAAITTVISEVIVLIICQKGSYSYHKKFNNKSLVSAFLGSCAIFFICKFISILNVGIFFETILSISISTILYFTILVLCKNDFALYVINKFYKR